MKTNEIIAALRQCEVNNPGTCRKCPVYNQSAGCLELLHKEAANTLEIQQKRIEELKKELGSAIHDLRVASECWSCKRNSECHPNMLVAGPDVCCGNYKWRGAADTNVGGKNERRWISVAERLPDADVQVLAIVSGRRENITFDHAYELASWSSDEGWIMEAWPELEDPDVTHWMPMPEPPGEVP